jgi:hypothetical protein
VNGNSVASVGVDTVREIALPGTADRCGSRRMSRGSVRNDRGAAGPACSDLDGGLVSGQEATVRRHSRPYAGRAVRRGVQRGRPPSPGRALRRVSDLPVVLEPSRWARRARIVPPGHADRLLRTAAWRGRAARAPELQVQRQLGRLRTLRAPADAAGSRLPERELVPSACQGRCALYRHDRDDRRLVDVGREGPPWSRASYSRNG